MSSDHSLLSATRRPKGIGRQAGADRHAGYNLLELAIVLAVIGTIAILGNNVVSHLAKQQQHANRTVSVDIARQALLTYLTRHHHLPCPDLTGNGVPGNAAGTCPNGRDIGYLPYAALDLPMPKAGEDLESRIVYGVFRDLASKADLVAPTRPDSDELDADGRNAFVHTLANAAKLPVTMQQPYVTGPYDPYTPNAPSGKLENCSMAVSNPAFAIATPGTPQSNGRLQRGGVNARLLNTNSKCFAAPDRTPDTTYGDVVHAESKFELLGWFASQID